MESNPLPRKTPPELIGQLAALIRSEALDNKTRWIYLNRLWFDPSLRRTVYDLLRLYFHHQDFLRPDTIILCPEGIDSSFGIIPFAAMLADEFRCPLAIWKEFGDMVLTTPSLAPTGDKPSKYSRCLLFQDVVKRGSTLRKVHPTISKIGWRINYYVCVVQFQSTRADLQEAIEDVERQSVSSEGVMFASMVKDLDLQGR